MICYRTRSDCEYWLRGFSTHPRHPKTEKKCSAKLKPRHFGLPQNCFPRSRRHESAGGVKLRVQREVNRGCSLLAQQERPIAVECREGDDMAHSPTQLSSVAPLQASGGDDPVPWPCPIA